MRKRLFGLATALTVLAVIGIVALNGPAQAAPGDPGTNFYAYLNGNSEVPPTASNTTGMATFHVNGDGTMSYTLNVYNILNPFMGHIHLGAPGVAGPVVVELIPMGKPNSGPQNIIASGTITAANLQGPLKGKPLSALVNQMAYNTYVNIHTSDGTMTPGIGNYPNGEIRGNIISADANRIGTQPALPTMVNVPTTGVTFPFPTTYSTAPAAPVGAMPAAPATGTQPLNPVNAPGVGASSPNAPMGSAAGQAANNPANAGGSTSGAASGAPTTGGTGSSTNNPTGGPGGSTGSGQPGGPLGAGTTITSGGTTGATSGSTQSSTSGSGTGGAGTVGNTSSGGTSSSGAIRP